MADRVGHQSIPWSGRAILHVDLDAFFAAVEQLDNPGWRGRAVIVGGSPEGRGVVSTASYEARLYGIRSAMPAAQAARLAPEDAVWVKPRFKRYEEVSKMVREIFFSITPHVQPVSIDEAYLDITPGRHSGTNPVSIAFAIAERVAALGITCSSGLGSSKTIAKIASDQRKPSGITIVYPGEEAAFLAPLPVETMSGIGPVTSSKLNSLGIKTLGDLSSLDEQTAVRLLGATGPAFVQRAAGVDERKIVMETKNRSISNEKTFRTDISDIRKIDEALCFLATKVARRLRKSKVGGKTIHLKVRFSDFTTRTSQTSLLQPCSDEQKIAVVAHDLFRELWTPGSPIRLLGVGVTNLEQQALQMDLLEEAGVPGGSTDSLKDQLLRSMDEVNDRFGEGTIRRGAISGTDSS